MLLAWIQVSEPVVASTKSPGDHAARHTNLGYARSLAEYPLPEVTLKQMDGTKVTLEEILTSDGPILLQFIFTTCPGVCPILSASFLGLQDQLGDDLETVRLVSISIDPEIDTPQRLREYAERFRAGPRWTFLTGSQEAVTTVQKAFDAYRGNKMRHEPTTYLRGDRGDRWLRLDGFPSASQLADEVRLLLPR
jgi:protein SCO1